MGTFVYSVKIVQYLGYHESKVNWSQFEYVLSNIFFESTTIRVFTIHDIPSSTGFKGIHVDATETTQHFTNLIFGF